MQIVGQVKDFMYKTLMLALSLLISAAWLQALEGYPPSNDQKSTPELTTIAGCLQYAGGSYSLTDSSGKVYRLAYSNKLNHHAGHEVQITGKPSVKTIDTSQQNIEPSAREIPIFEVKTVTHVADTCKAK